MDEDQVFFECDGLCDDVCEGECLIRMKSKPFQSKEDAYDRFYDHDPNEDYGY